MSVALMTLALGPGCGTLGGGWEVEGGGRWVGRGEAQEGEEAGTEAHFLVSYH